MCSLLLGSWLNGPCFVVSGEKESLRPSSSADVPTPSWCEEKSFLCTAWLNALQIAVSRYSKATYRERSVVPTTESTLLRRCSRVTHNRWIPPYVRCFSRAALTERGSDPSTCPGTPARLSGRGLGTAPPVEAAHQMFFSARQHWPAAV